MSQKSLEPGCLHTSIKDFLWYADRDCVQELKINPRRDEVARPIAKTGNPYSITTWGGNAGRSRVAERSKEWKPRSDVWPLAGWGG